MGLLDPLPLSNPAVPSDLGAMRPLGSCWPNQPQNVPVPPSRQIIGYNFNTNVIVGDKTGDLVASVFPNALKINSLKFDQDINIMSIILSSSIVNFDVTTAGVFAVVNQAPVLNLSGSYGVFISHLSLQNSVGATIAPVSRSNALGFGEDAAYRLPAQTEIGIYMSMSANVLDHISSILTIVWQMPGSQGIVG